MARSALRGRDFRLIRTTYARIYRNLTLTYLYNEYHGFIYTINNILIIDFLQI